MCRSWLEARHDNPFPPRVESGMAGRECYHCKQWIEEGEAHDCWTTTEAALTRDLSEDLRDAWERLRETAAAFGEQRIYASHNSIMFSRKSCYFFVRPKRSFLEVCVFLGRALKAPQVRRVDRGIEVQVRARHPDQAPRRGRGADHRLASRGVPARPTRWSRGPGRRARDRSRNGSRKRRPHRRLPGSPSQKAGDQGSLRCGLRFRDPFSASISCAHSSTPRPSCWAARRPPEASP